MIAVRIPSGAENNACFTKYMVNALRARDLESGETRSIKSPRAYDVKELDTIILDILKEWSFNKTLYISGTVIQKEFKTGNLQVPPHEYTSYGLWNPEESYGDKAPDYFADYLREELRESFEFDDYTGYGFYGPDSDPVFEAVESNTYEERYNPLVKLWEAYPQCIDALVHIGHMYLDSPRNIDRAIQLYQAAVFIAEQYFPPNFDPIFLWVNINNRPYLRALQGLCLALWRMEKFDAATDIVNKLLRLNPPDNQGVRFIIEDIRNHIPWRDDDCDN
ncbi:MAG: tetratricopeptide repeat protein [Bacteroidetes bacterium]|nr:tetratricopeptide repeat protein [Bacteroidota bacterium]